MEDTNDLKMIINAITKVRNEILRIKENYLEADKECRMIKNTIQQTIDKHLVEGIMPTRTRKRKVAPNQTRRNSKINTNK